MRCVLVLTVLVAAAGAATVSQSVSVGGSSSGGESVSVAETSSTINTDNGETLGIRSSFSSNRRRPAAASRPAVSAHRESTPVTAQRKTPATAQRRPTVTAQKKTPVSANRRPTVSANRRPTVSAQRRPTVTAHRETPVTGTVHRPRPAPVGAGPASLGGGIPVVPTIRPLKIHFQPLPAIGAGHASSIGTRFNNRGRPAAAAAPAVAPALANAQANLNEAAAKLNAVMSSLTG